MERNQSPLSRSISRAIASAEVRRLEMARTLDSGRTAQLLTDQADKARTSPLAEDQLLALALEAAASPGEFSAPVLDALREPPDPLEQLRLREAVFAAHDPAAARAVARAAPDWVVHKAGRRVSEDSQLMAGWLNWSAGLNAALWDHPALPVAPGFRALMLTCVGALRERAELMSGTKAEPSALAHTEGVIA